jgi:N-ethylmaleimide reductase
MAFAKLLEPVILGEFQLKNRIILASLTRARSGEDRVPNSANVEYYRQRAGYGLILSEATTISPMANGWACSPGLYTQQQVDGWKKVTDAVHEAGGLIVAQLWFIGRAGHSSYLSDSAQVVSASDIPIPGEVHTAAGAKAPYETPRPLTVEEIAGIVEDYGKAAENAKAAGFDGVEVHSANGYLLDQFLQTCSNKRTDDYGGAVENRYRFLKEVLDRVFKVYPPGRVGIKLSPNGAFNGMGSEDNVETFNYVLKQLDPLGLAYVQTMDGLAFGFHSKCAAQTLKDFRSVYSGNLVANCGYTPETAEEALKEGIASAVSFGRVTMSNPDLPERLRNGWPLAETLDMSHWYVADEAHRKDPTLGYADQPAHKA